MDYKPNICEDYLNGMEDIAHHKEKNFLAWCMFGEMRPYLDKSIGEIVLQEQNMYSDKYQVDGDDDNDDGDDDDDGDGEIGRASCRERV